DKSDLTRPANPTEPQTSTQANVARYIRDRERYDPYTIKENYETAAIHSATEAARELQAHYSVANTQNPAQLYARLRRVLVDIKSVTFPNTSTAIVRFSTTESSDTESIMRHWISVVRFRYTDTPTRNEWRFENPRGFQVYAYRRDQETVTSEEQR